MKSYIHYCPACGFALTETHIENAYLRVCPDCETSFLEEFLKALYPPTDVYLGDIEIKGRGLALDIWYKIVKDKAPNGVPRERIKTIFLGAFLFGLTASERFDKLKMVTGDVEDSFYYIALDLGKRIRMISERTFKEAE